MAPQIAAGPRHPADDGPRKLDRLGGAIESTNSLIQTALQAPVRAELIGDNTCLALGMTVIANAPVLALCRRLIETGLDPATPLQCYRGDVLSLTVRSIGEGAALEINAKGTGFLPFRAVRTALPMRQTCRAGVGQRAHGEAAP